MPTKKLNPAEWKEYFNKISKDLKNTLVTIEVFGPDLGDQTEVRWQLLKGLNMDPREDSLVVFTENLDHRISHPKDIFIEETAGNPTTIEITDADNNKQLIKLQDLTKKVA